MSSRIMPLIPRRLIAVALGSTSRATAIGRSTFEDQLVDGVRAITAAGDTAEIHYGSPPD